MSPSKDWSVSATMFCNGEWRYVRSKRSFAERFRILDPFQKHHDVRLSDTADTLVWLCNVEQKAKHQPVAWPC
jgi:hypothetical protein